MVALAAASSLLTTAACGLVGGKPETPVVPAGTVRVLTSAEPVLGYRIPGHREVAGLGLIGANATLQVHDTAVVSEIGETDGERWGLDGPVRAADGQELFWASLRTLDRAWTTEETQEPEFKVVAGEVSIALGIPKISTTADAVRYTDAVMVSVPKGGPVLLRMTDQGSPRPSICGPAPAARTPAALSRRRPSARASGISGLPASPSA